MTNSTMGSQSPVKDAGELARFLPYQLSIASNAVSAVIAERYRKRFALKIAEWRVIAVLGDASLRADGLTQRAIAAATLMDKVAVNRACKVLETRGLIARTQNATDGRSHLLELTGEGQAIREEVMPLARETERELCEGLTPTDSAVLRATLERLRARAVELLKRSGGDA